MLPNALAKRLLYIVVITFAGPQDVPPPAGVLVFDHLPDGDDVYNAIMSDNPKGGSAAKMVRAVIDEALPDGEAERLVSEAREGKTPTIVRYRGPIALMLTCRINPVDG